MSAHTVPSYQMTTRVAKCATQKKHCIFDAIMAFGNSGVIYAWNILHLTMCCFFLTHNLTFFWTLTSKSQKQMPFFHCFFFSMQTVCNAKKKTHARHYFNGIKQLLNLMHKCRFKQFQFSDNAQFFFLLLFPSVCN